MSLLEDARAALKAKQDTDAAAQKAAADKLRTDALAAVRGVLSGASTASLAALAPVHTDMAAGLVVVSDRTVHLGARRGGDGWVVRLVRQDAGSWTDVPQLPQIRSLADLAAAYGAG